MRGPTILLLILSLLPASAAEWPQWRGENRDGKSSETGLLRSWPAAGPPRAWQAEGLGAGFASFAVVDGRIYTQGQLDGRQYVMAFDLATGRQLWKTPNGPEYDDRRGDGPRGTPTWDAGRLYALAANGHLACLNAADGKKLWSVDLLSAFGARNTNWGISESPLVDGNRVIVTPGGSGGGIVALDKSNGKLIWKSEPDKAGYSSLVAADVNGGRQYVTLTGTAGVGIRADDGKTLWRYTQVANRTANVATPIVHDGHVFLSSDYGTGCALLKFQPDGSAEEVYFNRDMRNHYSTSVLVGGHLYGFSSSIFTCMDFKTGEVKWRDRSVGKGQVIHADGLLYLQGEGGDIALVEPNPEAYKELSRFPVGRGDYPTWTLPVIAGGMLLIRDQDTLTAFRVKQ